MIERRFPARDANAPPISRLQTREAPLGMRRDEIVAVEHREIKEVARDFRRTRCVVPCLPHKCDSIRREKILSSDRDSSISALFPEHWLASLDHSTLEVCDEPLLP